MSESRRGIWQNPSHGFRMMWWDPIAALVCGLSVVFAWPYLGAFSLVAPYVLGTFFLFCNVFRVPRRAELVWAFAFVANCGAWLAIDPLNPLIFAGPTLLTVGVVIWSRRQPGYHGIGSRA